MSGAIVLAMVRLRLQKLLADRMGLLWFFGMPLLFSFLMGNLLGDWSSDGAQRLPRAVAWVQQPGPAVDRLLLPLRDNARFQLVVADTLAAPAAARGAVDEGRLTAALLVPAGFAAAAAGSDTAGLRLFYDPDRLSSQTVRTLLDRTILRANTEAAARTLVAAPGPDGTLPRGRAARFDVARFDSLWQAPRVSLAAATLGRVEEDPGDGFALTSAYQHVGPAYTLFFVLMFVLLTAKELVTERQDRTLARLVTSRASGLTLVTGYFSGAMVLGLVQIALLLLLNGLLFGIDYGDSPATLALVVVLFAGVSAAGSILLGAVARTGGQTDGLSIAVTMMLAALGGLWWPLEVVPPFMQAVGRSLPTGQAITVFHDMIGRGWGLAECADPLAGLAVWFLLLFGLAVWRLRRLVTV